MVYTGQLKAALDRAFAHKPTLCCPLLFFLVQNLVAVMQLILAHSSLANVLAMLYRS